MSTASEVPSPSVSINCSSEQPDELTEVSEGVLGHASSRLLIPSSSVSFWL